MRLFLRVSLSIALPFTLMSVAVSANAAQSAPTAVELVRELGSVQTSDAAAAQLRKLANTDEATRNYLAAILPIIIQYGPRPPSEAWSHAVELSGDLKIVEATPALARWLDAETGGDVVFLADEENLLRCSPCMALSQIGDPSIPSVQAVLAHGKTSERWRAAFVLNKIGSVRARGALRKHLVEGDSDNGLVDYIRKVTSNR